MRSALRVSSGNGHRTKVCEFALAEVTPGLAALGSGSFSEYPVTGAESVVARAFRRQPLGN